MPSSSDATIEARRGRLKPISRGGGGAFDDTMGRRSR
jgi:hypothetical protein